MKLFTQWKQFLRDSNSGFTVMELLVASTLGMMMMAMTVGAAMANRNLFHYDIVRTGLNQNIRSAMDLIGVNSREAGENLPATFPAVEIIDNDPDPDELILRRNLLDEVLKVCVEITDGSTNTEIYFAHSGVSGCAHSGQQQNYNTWSAYRTGEGGSVKAYIYNSDSNVGEFFDYISENDNGVDEMYIQRSAGTWQNDYDVGPSVVYILEDWHFQIGQDWTGEDMLQVIENGDTANPMNVVFGITDFTVNARLQDGTVQAAFGAADEWTDLESIEVMLGGADTYREQDVTGDLTAKFFPRNILSN